MVNSEEMQKLKAQAESTAKQIIAVRYSGNNRQQLIELNWFKKRTRFSQTEAEKEFIQDKEKEEQRLVKEQFELLVASKKHIEEYTKASWTIFLKTMIPCFADGSEPLPDGWNHRFLDETTGTHSPTVEEIFRERNGLLDALALTDPNTFAKKISDKFEKRTFSYEYDRAELDPDGDWERSSNRYFEVGFMLRSRSFPPNP